MITRKIVIKPLIALLLGVVNILAFAPFNFSVLIFFSLGMLFWLWLSSSNKSEAFWTGWAFGLGQFGAGVSWMYVSLTTFGGMPWMLAAIAVLLLVMGLALFPALVGLSQQLFSQSAVPLRILLVIAPLWVVFEWIREWLFTGLPWLSAGYSQTDNFLSAWAPVGGVYLVSLVVVLLTGALVILMKQKKMTALATAVLILAASYVMNMQTWTSLDERVLSVKLVQGNVSIWDKWDARKASSILQKYLDLSEEDQATDLVIWPEAAAPVLMKLLPMEFLNAIKQKNNTYTLFGVIEKNPDTGQFYNSVVANQPDDSFAYYRKIQLVPFGEFLPFKFMLQWLLDYLHIPMSDFTAYEKPQPPISIKGIKIGVSICYEDAFANVIRQSLPEADLLVNVSEDAWFGNSLAPHQRLQMAQMRAIENGRTLIRVSNNGLSSMINYKGEIKQIAPQFKTHVFVANAEVRSGVTPFSLFGHKFVLSCILGLLLIGVCLQYRFNK